MEVIKEIKTMHEISHELRENCQTIGFVPTMGFLHEGHTSLMKKAKNDCSKTVISIFVNPAQFGPDEDFDKYPRDFNRDYKIAGAEGVDYIFFPSVEEMYNGDFRTFVRVGGLNRIMCGKFRPTHFDGVCTVVLKLLNIIFPHKAYFGQKDFQQLLIIRKMVHDLNAPFEIIGCPIVREEDGLALSSRNKYLSAQERKNAAILFKSINAAAASIRRGMDLKEAKKASMNILKENKYVSRIDYFDFRNAETLEEIKNMDGFRNQDTGAKILIASAIWIGNTRLIDNMVL